MPLYQVISGTDGSKELVEVGAGGGGETWGVHVDALPADPSALIADLPVGAFVTDNAGGGTDLEPRVVALEEDMTAVTQTVTDGDTSKTTIAAHQDEDGIYGVATDTKYGHVRVLEAAPENPFTGDVLSIAGTKKLVAGVSGSTWPEDSRPSFGTMVDDTTCLVPTSGTYSLAGAKYELTLVGGGGAGTAGNYPYSGPTAYGGSGGGAALPITKVISSTGKISLAVTIGAGGANTIVTALGSTVTGVAGTAGGGGAGGQHIKNTSATGQASYGSTGPSGAYPGGAGGSAAGGVLSGDEGSTFPCAGSGGGGGAGSRLIKQLSNVPTAASGGSVSKRYASDDITVFGNGGGGGTGYGAGGGGGGVIGTTYCSPTQSGAGGAGAPGCLLITYLGAAL